jgi:hypothetical protein
LALGLHLNGAGELLCIASGGALLLINLVTVGKLGLANLLSRRLHHVVDGVLIVALLVAAATRFSALRPPAALLAIGLAVLLFWFERSTRYDGSKVPGAKPSPDSLVAPLGNAGPAGAGPLVPRRGVIHHVHRGARTAGLVVGVTRRVARDRPGARRGQDPAPPTPS